MCELRCRVDGGSCVKRPAPQWRLPLASRCLVRPHFNANWSDSAEGSTIAYGVPDRRMFTDASLKARMQVETQEASIEGVEPAGSPTLCVAP